MAFAFVVANNAGVGSTAGTSLDVSLAVATATNMVAGVCVWGSGDVNDLTQITDNGTGGTWVIKRRVADSGNSTATASFYGYGWSAAPTTITMNLGSSLEFRGITVQAFSGQETGDPIDGTNEAGRLEANPGTGADGADSGTTLTPSADNYLVFTGSINTGAVGGGGSEFTAGSVGTEPTNAEHSASAEISLSSEYEIQTTATARLGAMTVSQDTAHVTFTMVFKVAGGAAATAWGPLLALRNNRLVVA